MSGTSAWSVLLVDLIDSVVTWIVESRPRWQHSVDPLLHQCRQPACGLFRGSLCASSHKARHKPCTGCDWLPPLQRYQSSGWLHRRRKAARLVPGHSVQQHPCLTGIDLIGAQGPLLPDRLNCSVAALGLFRFHPQLATLKRLTNPGLTRSQSR